MGKILVYSMSLNGFAPSLVMKTEICAKTLVLRARLRPSSSNQFEKMKSQRDYDKAADVRDPDLASSPSQALLTESTTKLVF